MNIVPRAASVRQIAGEPTDLPRRSIRGAQGAGDRRGAAASARESPKAFARLGADSSCTTSTPRASHARIEALAVRRLRPAPIAGDLSKPGGADEAFARRSGAAGRIDFLVNNAGRSWGVETADITERARRS